MGGDDGPFLVGEAVAALIGREKERQGERTTLVEFRRTVGGQG